MSSAIQIQNLTKSYKGKKRQVIHALKKLNLEIKSGETFGFIGPNGAGKTTTIKILTGLLFPTGGTATLFGKSVLDPKARASIGYLSEVAAYSPYFEAEELLMAFGALDGIPRRETEKRSRELLELVGLLDRSRSRLGEFSKGMLQRFGIAQALLHNPSLLILDEPTSGLDPIAQREVLDILHRLKDQGITIFFSSHRLVEVEGLCDYVGIVSLGDLIFYGTLTQLETQEAHTPFSVRFKDTTSAKPESSPPLQSRVLEGDMHETIVEREMLDNALRDLQARGATIVSVAPKRSPLEDIFVRLVTRHQRGDAHS